MSRIYTPCDEKGHNFKNHRVMLHPEKQQDGTWWQVKEPTCTMCGKGMGVRFPIKQVREPGGEFTGVKVRSQ